MVRLFLAALLAACLGACSPALNWRSVALADLGLRASLPCKPERLQRGIELAGTPVQVQMVGCSADGATFAMACAALVDPAQTAGALTHWRAAVLAGLRAPPAGHSGAAEDRPFVPAGALAVPQSVRTRAQGRQPGGAAVAMQGVWFARLQGAQVRVCHAGVYSPQPRADVADAFFAALALT